MALNLAHPSLDALTLQKLLRRDSVEKLALVLKGLLILLMLYCLWIFVNALLDATIGFDTDLSSSENKISQLTGRPSLTEIGQAKKDPAAYDVIASKSLLGPLQAARTPEPRATSARPVSNAQLALIGTFLTQGREPYAIIEDQKKNNQDVFLINESIFGEAVLRAIKADQVEIERNGQRELLVLDDLSPGGAAQFKDGVAVVDNNLVLVEEAELQKALDNIPMVLTQARAVPYFKDGRSVGLRLFAIKTGSLFEKIGLKNADILKEINGEGLADMSQAIKLFETLKSQRSITVKLERSNESRELRYEIR